MGFCGDGDLRVFDNSCLGRLKYASVVDRALWFRHATSFSKVIQHRDALVVPASAVVEPNSYPVTMVSYRNARGRAG